MKRLRVIALGMTLLLAAVAGWASLHPVAHRLALHPNLEDRLPDGSFYNPSTQSFLRGNHWLDQVSEAAVEVGRSGTAAISLSAPDQGHHLKVKNLPLDQLVPRLHYDAASPPGAFDAFNLMLAEYSRNSLSVPIGKPKDSMANFETDLEEAVPWTLKGDYEFQPNPQARPVRFGIVNNCLAPGLWELIASDRTGDVYHSWFEMPLELYVDVLARTNGVDRDFARQAVTWKTDPVPLELERLRNVQRNLAESSLAAIVDVPVGFSSQDSRRKLHKQYVEIETDQGWASPQNIDELTSCRSRFADFIAPGKYSVRERKQFDFRFLREVDAAEIREVEPLTHYDWQRRQRMNNDQVDKDPNDKYLELVLKLKQRVIVIGNLPARLLVPQEDFVLNGFGVGVLSSSGLAERRKYLIDDGPAPSFAYLAIPHDDELIGLNSHDFGLEQIFIRTHINAENPWWEITITSYERVVDIVKYRVAIPQQLQPELKNFALVYVSPLHRTYRDDNLR